MYIQTIIHRYSPTYPLIPMSYPHQHPQPVGQRLRIQPVYGLNIHTLALFFLYLNLPKPPTVYIDRTFAHLI